MQGGETYKVNKHGSRTISMGKCIPVRIIFSTACVMLGEFSGGWSCYPGYMTVCPTTPCWMGAYSSPSISSWGLSLFDFLTFDTRQARREVEDKWFKNRGILRLSQFPCALWPTKGIESQSIHGGLVPGYPHPADASIHGYSKSPPVEPQYPQILNLLIWTASCIFS